MFKYTAKNVYDRALSIADLQNSQFINWGDAFQMLNSSYRKIYNDCISNGDLNYLNEVELLSNGSNSFELPVDFYQLAVIVDAAGNEIPRLPLNASRSDFGYQIKNDIIYLQNVKNSVIMKYYPSPYTITFKKPQRTQGFVNSTYGAPISGFDTILFTAGGYWINMQGGGYTGPMTIPSGAEHFIVGKAATLVVTGQSCVTYWNGTTIAADSLIKPVLTTEGDFITNSFDENGTFGWANNDLSARYMTDGTNIFYNNNNIGTVEDLCRNNLNNGRVIYWNGQWCLVTLSKIVYPDGSWETTDVPGSLALLKCDTETGYGYVIRVNNTSYTVIGWTPDTIIDYPDNILFDLTCYDLAIQFRVKQSADASGLKEIYNQLEKTYLKSLSDDDANFVRIRNVNNRYGRWRY